MKVVRRNWRSDGARRHREDRRPITIAAGGLSERRRLRKYSMNADCKVVYNNMKTPPEAERRSFKHSRWQAAACLSSYRSMVIHEVTADRRGRWRPRPSIHRNHPCVLVPSVFRLPSGLFDNDKFMLASEQACGRRPIRTSAMAVNANEALTRRKQSLNACAARSQRVDRAWEANRTTCCRREMQGNV